MKSYKKLLSLILCISLITIPILPTKAETGARQVEYLGRGGYAVAVDNGIYLSWRLLGTEAIGETFDIYRNDDTEPFVSDLDATNYTDTNGNICDVYKVTPHNGTAMENDVFIASTHDYKDVILDKPEGGEDYTYEFNEVSVGDVDNDGEYEFIVKWDPTNRQDNSIAGYTGNVLIDCYKQNGTKLWRVDLGKNIRAGSHYTQLMVYDFDGDGKAEMALRTTVGSKDGKGNYVSAKGAPVTIDGVSYPLTWQDEYTNEVFTDESDLRSAAGGTLGKILTGPDWLTMFNGETGEAIQTVNYYPQRGNVNSWGDSYANRSERYNAGVAYLDGVHPSLVTARGYYARAAMAAYDWNGTSFTMRWHRDDKGNPEVAKEGHGKMNGTLYGNGDHQISVCDADNDGKDEIVFGSTVVDNDGSILNSTDHGHGDALHVSDFNNDGEQEIFQVHEEDIGFKEFGAEVRKAGDASIMAKVSATEDVGRGLMGNFDDDYNDTSEFFSSANTNLYDFNGNLIGDAPANINPSFLIWWDGDLERELLSRTTILKYDIKTNTKKTVRGFSDVHFGDKDAPALSADLLGDWREEICYPTDDNGTLRIFMTTTPTDYKMPTLMHDTQYRTAIAWQNCGYNQPPHPKFYVGKAALGENGRYLSPAAGFDTVTTTGTAPSLVYPTVQENPTGPFTVTVKAIGDISRVISSKEVEGGGEYSYGFPQYIVEDGIAYEATANSTGTRYGGTIANVIKDTSISVTYKKAYGGVVYLEDIDIEVGGKSADIRASNCLAQDNKPYTSQYVLKPDNSYTIVLGYQNSNRGTQFIADGNTFLTVTNDDNNIPANTWGTKAISGVTVQNESPISTLPGGSNTYDPLDTILIINETAQNMEPTEIDPTSPEGTGLSVTGAQSVTADSAIIAGVKNDDGSKTP
ncbi:MAG: rhamnogalacturonan lyase, partial [Clostridia bacterium]|nr:rhamnogalacturonan lyase [Clostridia bacterium]